MIGQIASEETSGAGSKGEAITVNDQRRVCTRYGLRENYENMWWKDQSQSIIVLERSICTGRRCQPGGPFCTNYSAAGRNPDASPLCVVPSIHIPASCQTFAKILVPECTHGVCRSRTYSLDPYLSVFSRDDRDDNRGACALLNMYK